MIRSEGQFDPDTKTVMSKSDLQSRDGWVSPYPGPQYNGGPAHPNWSPNVSPEQQTKNAIADKRARNTGDAGSGPRTMTGA